MKRFLKRLFQGSPQPSSSRESAPAKTPDSPASLEKKLAKFYRQELKLSSAEKRAADHARIAERLIALGDAEGSHAKFRFVKNRGEIPSRLLPIAEQAYALEPSSRSALLLARQLLDMGRTESVDALVAQVAAASHPESHALQLRLTDLTHGKAAALAAFHRDFDDPALPQEAHARLFTQACRLFSPEMGEFGARLIASSPPPPARLLREIGAHLFVLRDFTRTAEVVDLLEPSAPFDALWLGCQLASHNDSRQTVWADAFTQVRIAASAAQPDALRLLPYFWRQTLAEAIKYQPDDQLLLEQIRDYFADQPCIPGDLDLAIGVLRRLASKDRAALEAFASLFKQRLWPSQVPRDWLGNVDLLTAKLLDVLSHLHLTETFLAGLPLDIVPQPRAWLTAYQFATPRICGPANAQLLQSHAEFQRHLALSSAGAFFDARVSADERAAMMNLFITALHQQRPFSAIRLCDGESYGYPRLEAVPPDQHEADMRSREVHWWGRTITPQQRTFICEGFREAVHHSDLIGIPNAFRLIRDIDITGTSLLASRTARNIASVAHHVAEECRSGLIDISRTCFTDERFHHLLFARIDEVRPLLSAARRLVIVSCYSTDLIHRHVSGLHHLETILIPPHTMTAGLSDYPDKNVILPEVLPELLDQLRHLTQPGTLVLVAAGFAGKLFLKAARDRGGVALDVGVTLDYWLGLKTRSHVDTV